MMKAIWHAFEKLLSRLDDLLFPEEVLCLCCEHAIGEDAQDGVCPGCMQALEELALRQELLEAEREQAEAEKRLPPGLDYIHAAYPYQGQARTLIRRLKYESVRSACVPLARKMAYLPSGEEEMLVPVPTDSVRQRRRGFNQAMLLAEAIGSELGMEVCPALTRVKRRRPQTGLSAQERRENLVGCMKADDRVKGRRVLLVDDVYTTGSTAGEAARALLEAGALSVGMFAAARAHEGRDEAHDPFQMTQKKRENGEKSEKS